MGLDIYKLEVSNDKNADWEFVLNENEKNKSTIKLFDKFKNYIVEIEIEDEDLKKSFELKNINFEEFEKTGVIRHDYVEENGKVKHIYNNLTTKEKLEIYQEEIIKIKKLLKVLYFNEIDYQRKGMNINFYKEIYGSCWYVNGDDTNLNEEDYTYFILDNDLLKKVKTYVIKDESNLDDEEDNEDDDEDEDCYPYRIKCWTLNENEIIYFNA